MSKKNILIEIRSDEVQELLTRVPSSIVRWGITVVAAIVFLLMAMTWFIHYPDLVDASFKLTSSNAPRAVVTRTEGRIVKLLARSNEVVKKDAPIAYIESSADHEEVLRLSNALQQAIREVQNAQVMSSALPEFGKLGELQTAYQTFKLEYDQQKYFAPEGFYAKQQALWEQELSDLKKMETNLLNQKALEERDLKIAAEEFATQKKLADESVISNLDLRREESKFISKQLPHQQTLSAIASNNISQRNKMQEILALDKQVQEGKDRFVQSLNTLQSLVESWKLRYIIAAPVDGTLQLPILLQENQHVEANKTIFYIAPVDNNFVGELTIPQQNFGKVEVGQSVLIKFPAYPYQEFGSIRGTVTEISNVSFSEESFQAKVVLPDGLKSNFGKQLRYKAGMAASAQIITDDTRLLEKIFNQLRLLTSR